MNHKDKQQFLEVVKTNHCKNIRKPVLLYWALFMLFIFSFTIKGHAQDWAPEGSVWTYTQTFVFSSRIDTLVIRTIGDTVIQDKECKILQRSAGTCDLRPGKEYMYADSGKVFFYEALRDDFQMLYDFNADSGQSWTIITTHEGSASPDTITVTIDSVNTLLVNGILLKKQFVNYTSDSWWLVCGPGINIEGIGNTGSMFPWFYGFCDANWAGPLRCYYDNMLGLVDFETAPTCDYVSLGINDDEPDENPDLFPNPVANEIFIKGYENSRYSIFNTHGQIIQKGIIRSNTEKLELQNLKDGLYILSVTNGSKANFNRMIIKR